MAPVLVRLTVCVSKVEPTPSRCSVSLPSKTLLVIALKKQNIQNIAYISMKNIHLFDLT